MSKSESIVMGTLDVESVATANHVDLMVEQYDIGFYFPSWDSRSKCIAACENLRATHMVEIAYTNTGESYRFGENRKVLIEYAEKHSEFQGAIPADMAAMEQVCRKINSKISEVANDLRRPLKVMIDLSMRLAICGSSSDTSTPGIFVLMAENSPRTSAAASGLGSHKSMWLGAPQLKIIMTDLALGVVVLATGVQAPHIGKSVANGTIAQPAPNISFLREIPGRELFKTLPIGTGNICITP